eukprot:m.75636 g.75636  ORF g.75636 m.75636 type:complete len:489 (-) comp24809_c0_seq2:64-1530(-)
MAHWRERARMWTNKHRRVVMLVCLVVLVITLLTMIRGNGGIRGRVQHLQELQKESELRWSKRTKKERSYLDINSIINVGENVKANVGLAAFETHGYLEELEISKAIAIVWRLPVGCDFSGFFVEVLSVLPALAQKLPANSLFFDMGECGSKMFNALPHDEATFLKTIQYRSRDILARINKVKQPFIIIQHKLPGNMYLMFENQHKPLFSIGRAMTESTLVAPEESEMCTYVDQVWVPTQWHRDVFTKAHVFPEKLVVFPEAVDSDFFNPTEAPRHHRNAFVFVSVFKWERRKGFDVLLRAYWEEFRHEKHKVALVLRTYKPGWEPGPDNLYEQFRDIARNTVGETNLSKLPLVKWIDKDLSKHALRSLYSNSNAFVLPTRGEGWGLPVVEAMSMGLPVIVTNFSGPTAYVSEDTAFPVAYTSINYDGTAEPNITDLRRQMRRASSAAHRSKVSQIGLNGRLFVQSRYNPDRVASIAVDIIEDLLNLKL